MQGNLIIVSAPSGAGKTTLVQEVLKRVPGVKPSVSYTSRAPRADEVNAVHYHFVTRAEFEALAAQGEFLEWAEVHGNLYGTARRAVAALLAEGNDVVLTIDVQGAAQARQLFPVAISVFILPPSFQALLERLDGRGGANAADLQVRLQNALFEIAQYPHYDYIVINDELLPAVDELAAIIRAERCRRARRSAEVESIRQTFQTQQNEKILN
jgi:guanylate kinase